MAQFKKGDCQKIIIEIVETPHGRIDAVSMKNIRWLIEMGFQIAIDDLTLILEDITNENISRGIFDALK